MPIIKITNLHKKIKKHNILKGINLEIKETGIYGFIGRNGSGKSVFFKTLVGLMVPTSGTINVFGDAIEKGKFPKSLGALLDTGGFLKQYSGFRNLKILASILNKIDDERIKEVLILVGLDPNDSRPVSKYSLGMKQRLGIAQAIMEKPNLLILDEPMNALDEKGVENIRKLLLKLKEQGVTILLASHNTEDIQLLCDTVYKIDQGELSLENEEVSFEKIENKKIYN
ncbi:MAG: ATP-binding cassette domain-containing protein [Kurthia gibsonii]